LNRLGIPTAYQKDGRGVRGKRTQGVWRPGRIRNLVVNPVYKGALHYGRRTKREREVIVAEVPALVSEELWGAAQATLHANRIMAKNTTKTYFLRGLIVCGTCGLHYCGSANRGKVWYRCDGQLVERGPVKGRCPGKSVAGPDLELVVWDDILRFLRDPGDLLDELAAEREMSSAAAVAEAQRQTLLKALADNDARRERLLDALESGHLEPADLRARLDKLDDQKATILAKLQEAEQERAQAADQVLSEDLLDELRRRLERGLDDGQRREIARLLVRRITIHTKPLDGGKKQASAVVEYRFPEHPGVVNDRTGRGSWRPPA
jgi:site-specific DNA recombinase